MAILILALCGRPLAQAARRVDADVIVADLFGDADTRSLAPWYRLPGDLGQGIQGDALLAWVRALDERLDGIVYGAGFETDPPLLGRLAQIAPLLGNTAETVAAVKDPHRFAALLRDLALPHPEIARSPRPGHQWLRKRRGGSGGTHIDVASSASPADAAHYFQAMTPGHPISALFVGNGTGARVLGISAQWPAPTAMQPFRYGGCAGPVRLVPDLARAIQRACGAITAAAGLVGLNSLDMLLDRDRFSILEVNPRPGATLDLFDDREGPSLWDCHLRGVRGELPPPAPAPRARAALVVYADLPRYVPASFEWGVGIADVPVPNSRISEGMPVCTVKVAGADAETARAAAEQRAAALLQQLPLLRQQSA